MKIRVTSGACGVYLPDGQFRAMTARDGIFELDGKQAARLLSLHVAELAEDEPKGMSGAGREPVEGDGQAGAADGAVGMASDELAASAQTETAQPKEKQTEKSRGGLEKPVRRAAAKKGKA